MFLFQLQIFRNDDILFDKKTIYSCGITLTFLRRFHDIGRGRKDSQDFSKPKNIFGACSACALYNRKMLNELKEESGYFDSRFFFLVEDLDLAWRAQKRKWKVLFCPQAVSYHKGESSRFPKKMRQYFCFRNRYYSIIKNEGFIFYIIKIIPLIVYDLPRLIYLIFTNPYVWSRPKQ